MSGNANDPHLHDFAERVTDMTTYTPEDYAEDFFDAKRKISDIKEELRQARRNVMMDFSESNIRQAEAEDIVKGRVLYKRDLCRNKDLWFVVAKPLNNGISFIDTDGKEHLLSNNMYMKVYKNDGSTRGAE